MEPFIITAKTDLYAILGSPIRHAMSPVIHNSAFRRLGMDKAFFAVPCTPADVEETMRTLIRMDLRGYVFTMPVKEMASQFMDEIRDEAALTGAINCVQNEDGRLIGYNTDSIGFWTAIQAKRSPENPVKGVFVMGMGGLAKAAIAQAALQGVKEIFVANHLSEVGFVERFEVFANKLRDKIPDCNIHVYDWKPETWKEALAQVDVVANGTPNGMGGKGDLHQIFPYEAVPAGVTFFDAIYSPLKTAYLEKAQSLGFDIIDGLDLLDHQGAASFKIWTGIEVSPDLMREDGLRFLGEKHT